MDETNEIFQEILESIGSYGKFQKRFSFFYNFIFVTINCMPPMSIILALAVPDHWCHIPGREDTSYTLEEWKDIHIPIEKDNWGKLSHSFCKMYNLTDVSLEFNRSTADQIACQYGYDYDKTWFTSTIPTSQGWVCDKKMYTSNVYAISTVGEVIGPFILGQMGDYLGRRKVYLIACCLTFFGKILGIFTVSHYYIFLISTIIASFPSMTAFQSVLAISMEMTSQEKTSQLTQLQNYGWCLSMAILLSICWLFPDWIIFTIIATLPLGVYIATWSFLIESPRWLANRGKIDESIKVLERIAKVNGTKLEENLKQKLQKCSGKHEAVYGVMSIFSSPRLAKNTILLLLTFITFSICISTFMLNTTNLGGNPYLQFFFQTIIELPGYMLGKYFSNIIGRRYTAALANFVAATLFLVAVIVLTCMVNISLNIFLLPAKFCLAVTYFTLVLQIMEIFPTCLRQTGMSIGNMMGALAAILTPYIVYIGTAYDARYPYVIVCCLCFMSTLVQMLLPETLHVKLPETLQEARVFGREQSFFYAPWKNKKTETKETNTKIDEEQAKFIERNNNINN